MTKPKNKLSISSKNLKIRDIHNTDAENVLILLKDVYDNSYPNPDFYNINFITQAIKQVDNKILFWKIAEYDGEVIGQMMTRIQNKRAMIEFVMVQPKYREKAVMLLLLSEMERILINLDKGSIRAIYAITTIQNTPVIRLLNHFKLKNCGKLPSIQEDRDLAIFGRIENVDTWKIIKPHISVALNIQKSIIKNNLKRCMCLESEDILDLREKSIQITEFNILSYKSDFEKYYFLTDKTNRNILAEFREDGKKKIWYNLQFLRTDIKIQLKYASIKFIIDLFKNESEIKCLTVLVNPNDSSMQKILISIGFRFLGYLPSFIDGEDRILLGINKREVLKNYEE